MSGKSYVNRLIEDDDAVVTANDPIYKQPDYTTADQGFAKDEKLRQDYLAGLEQEVASKRKTADQFGGQIQASKDKQYAAERAARRKSAQVLAGIQARSGGGGGAILALGSQLAADRGVAEGEIGSQYGAQRADLALQQAKAGEDAAAAATDSVVEQRKMNEIGRGYDAKLNQFKADVTKALQDRGWFFSSDADKQAVIKKAKTELAGQLPQEQRALFLEWLDTSAMTDEVDGRWDI